MRLEQSFVGHHPTGENHLEARGSGRDELLGPGSFGRVSASHRALGSFRRGVTSSSRERHDVRLVIENPTDGAYVFLDYAIVYGVAPRPD